MAATHQDQKAYTVEDQLQAACWHWAWNTYPDARRLFWAVPNGGQREWGVGIKLQATGVIPGVHDMHLLWRGRFYTFEFKVKGRKLTRDRILRGKPVFGQAEWGEAISRHGGTWFKIESLEDFKHEFTRIMESS